MSDRHKVTYSSLVISRRAVSCSMSLKYLEFVNCFLISAVGFFAFVPGL